MLANFHVCGIMLMLRAVSNMLVRHASGRGPICFRCLIFSLSGSCDLCFMCFSVNGSVSLVCCVFDSVW